jgi:heme oxygenase
VTLREAISDAHNAAESHPFTALIMAGQLPARVYFYYLKGLLACYESIETRARELGLLVDMDGICRADLMALDLASYQDAGELASSDISASYTRYVRELTREEALAHLYVLHMGDMYGGQIMKSKLPGPNNRYLFDDRPKLISCLRAKLTDSMSTEAIKVFTFIIALFDEAIEIYEKESI